MINSGFWEFRNPDSAQSVDSVMAKGICTKKCEVGISGLLFFVSLLLEEQKK